MKVKIDGIMYHVVTIDAETYWDTNYTLSKMSTSEYIRDPRFKVHLIGVKCGPSSTYFTDLAAFEKYMQLIPRPIMLLGHHLQFDGFILHEYTTFKPDFYADTLSMSRLLFGPSAKHDLDSLAKRMGLGGKVKKQALLDTKGIKNLTEEQLHSLGEYCIDDINDTELAFNKMISSVPSDELHLINETVRMFCDPVFDVNTELAKQVQEKEIARKRELVEKCGFTEQQLRSNVQFAKILEDLGVDPPTKISTRTGKQTFAFAKSDEEFTALLDHPNEAVRYAVEARIANKTSILETRAERLVAAGSEGSKRLPVYLKYAAAVTHRWSGGNKINVQNFPRGSDLRKCIIAPKDHVIIVADSSQIEARTLAQVAGQDDLLDAFRKGICVYSEMGAEIFPGKSYAQIKAEDGFERQVGKIAILGLGYHMGAIKYRMMCKAFLGIDIGQEIAERTVALYRNRNYMIRKFWKTCDEILAFMVEAGRYDEITYKHMTVGAHHIRFPNGSRLIYPGLKLDPAVGQYSYYSNGYRKGIYNGLLAENIIQKTARDIIAEQMVRISQELDYMRIGTMSHDEIVTVTHEDRANMGLREVLAIMRTPPTWAPNLPVNAKGGYAKEYSK